MNIYNENFPKNRIQYLMGKTELSDEDIAMIIELHHEYPNMNSLKKYTTKKYRDLSIQEKKELIEALLNDEEYLKYKKCFIAKSKLLYDSDAALIKETEALSCLSNLGYTVYLLPYAYARDDMGCYQKSADSITEGDFLEMKNVISTGDRAGQKSYTGSRKQADNVFISFENEISEKKAINNIFREIEMTKQKNEEKGIKNNFEGYVFLNFTKANKTNLYYISKEGRATKLEGATLEHFKKYKGAIYTDSQVAENPMTKHGSPLSTNITHENKNVNNKEIPNLNILTKPMDVRIGKIVISCKKGILEGFRSAVRCMAKLVKENKRLRRELDRLTRNRRDGMGDNSDNIGY